MAAPSLAAPDDALATCSAAFSAGPNLIKEGKLLAARSKLSFCMSDACPRSMRPLCAQDLARLDERIPTIVFVAKGARGEDLLDVRVLEATRVVAAALDGKAIALDPGPHRFRFERAGSQPLELSVIVREGEKMRAIEGILQDVGPSAAPAGQDSVPSNGVANSASPPSAGARPIPWTVYAAGGVTLVAASSFGYFGGRGLAERADMSDCKGSCDPASVERTRTHFTVADISLAVGVAALAATAIFYFTRPTASQARAGAVASSLAVTF